MSFLKNLFGHHEAQNAHNDVYGGNQDFSSDYQQQNRGSFTHESIAAAAGFEALRKYEEHVRRTGQQVSHPMMKEMLAGFAAAEVDKLFETKGLDYLDREKAKHMAIQQAHQLAHDKYGAGGVYNGGDSQGYGGNNSGNYQQGQFNDFNQGYGGDNYENQGYGGDSYGNQGYGGDKYGNQGFGGDYQQQNYDGNQGQQQQWGDGYDQPRPEHHHHHHHRREDE